MFHCLCDWDKHEIEHVPQSFLNELTQVTDPRTMKGLQIIIQINRISAFLSF